MMIEKIKIELGSFIMEYRRIEMSVGEGRRRRSL